MRVFSTCQKGRGNMTWPEICVHVSHALPVALSVIASIFSIVLSIQQSAKLRRSRLDHLPEPVDRFAIRSIKAEVAIRKQCITGPASRVQNSPINQIEHRSRKVIGSAKHEN